MTRETALRRIIELLEDEQVDNTDEVFKIASEFDICLTEIWDNEDDNIIGMAVEDIVIYY